MSALMKNSQYNKVLKKIEILSFLLLTLSVSRFQTKGCIAAYEVTFQFSLYMRQCDVRLR